MAFRYPWLKIIFYLNIFLSQYRVQKYLVCIGPKVAKYVVESSRPFVQNRVFPNDRSKVCEVGKMLLWYVTWKDQENSDLEHTLSSPFRLYFFLFLSVITIYGRNKTLLKD